MTHTIAAQWHRALLHRDVKGNDWRTVMIAVSPGHDGAPAHWRLIGRNAGGADVLATAPLGRAARGPNWQPALERLRDGDGNLLVSLDSDGHYRWVLADSSGDVIAQSPAVYRDGESCRRAFTFAQRAARAVVGGNLARPAGATGGGRPAS